MNNRMKKVRIGSKERTGRKLTQEQLAEEMHVSRDTISSYEIGRVKPNNLYIKSFCEKFGVSESWLRTGEGEMYVPRTKEDEIADLVKKLYDGPDDQKIEVIKWFVDLNDEELNLLKNFAKALLGVK